MCYYSSQEYEEAPTIHNQDQHNFSIPSTCEQVTRKSLLSRFLERTLEKSHLYLRPLCQFDFEANRKQVLFFPPSHLIFKINTFELVSGFLVCRVFASNKMLAWMVREIGKLAKLYSTMNASTFGVHEKVRYKINLQLLAGDFIQLVF